MSRDLGFENGTENFGARYVDESLDLVKIDSVLLAHTISMTSLLVWRMALNILVLDMWVIRSIWSKLTESCS